MIFLKEVAKGGLLFSFISYWMKRGALWIDQHYLEFIICGLLILVITLLFSLALKKKQGQYAQDIAHINSEMQEAKKSYLEELCKAEMSIKKFKRELYKQREEYQDNMRYADKQFAQHVQKLKRDRAKIYSKANIHFFELKQEMRHVHLRQFEEVKSFQKEVKELKKEIRSLHDNHAREIKRSELEISDLRKQLRALIYKV